MRSTVFTFVFLFAGVVFAYGSSPEDDALKSTPDPMVSLEVNATDLFQDGTLTEDKDSTSPLLKYPQPNPRRKENYDLDVDSYDTFPGPTKDSYQNNPYNQDNVHFPVPDCIFNPDTIKSPYYGGPYEAQRNLIYPPSTRDSYGLDVDSYDTFPGPTKDSYQNNPYNQDNVQFPLPDGVYNPLKRLNPSINPYFDDPYEAQKNIKHLPTTGHHYNHNIQEPDYIYGEISSYPRGDYDYQQAYDTYHPPTLKPIYPQNPFESQQYHELRGFFKPKTHDQYKTPVVSNYPQTGRTHGISQVPESPYEQQWVYTHKWVSSPQEKVSPLDVNKVRKLVRMLNDNKRKLKNLRESDGGATEGRKLEGQIRRVQDQLQELLSRYQAGPTSLYPRINF